MLCKKSFIFFSNRLKVDGVSFSMFYVRDPDNYAVLARIYVNEDREL